jgi:hypothetical protein
MPPKKDNARTMDGGSRRKTNGRKTLTQYLPFHIIRMLELARPPGVVIIKLYMSSVSFVLRALAQR